MEEKIKKELLNGNDINGQHLVIKNGDVYAFKAGDDVFEVTIDITNRDYILKINDIVIDKKKYSKYFVMNDPKFDAFVRLFKCLYEDTEFSKQFSVFFGCLIDCIREVNENSLKVKSTREMWMNMFGTLIRYINDNYDADIHRVMNDTMLNWGYLRKEIY